MTLGNLYSAKSTLDKIIHYSFENPLLGFELMQYTKKVDEYFDYLQKELSTIVASFSKENQFNYDNLSEEEKTQYNEKINSLLNMPVYIIDKFPVSIIDIQKGVHPNDKNYWLSAQDFLVIEQLCNNKEKEKDGD